MTSLKTQGRTMKKLAASLLATATVALGITLLVPATSASAADVTINLSAEVGSTTLPGLLGPVNVTVWGYTDSGAAITAPGGPTITVTQGDTVTVNFTNNLPEPSGVIFRGQAVPPDLTGANANGGTATYTFTADRPGTYLYEAGLLPHAEYQASMGLYGALVVDPATPGQAYGGADSAFDQSEVLVLGEIDPALNNAADPAAFDMRKFSPKYSLVNGDVYPNASSDIPVDPESRVLLRYVNAGALYRSMATLGAGQSVIALDGNPLEFPRRYVAETFGPGQTADSIVTTPAAGANEKRVAVYDGSLLLHNSNVAGVGGMLTFLTVAGTGDPTDAVGPVTSAVAYTGDQLTATIDDTTVGGSPVVAAEYYLDDFTTPVAFSGGLGGVSADVSATVTVGNGAHTLYVRGQDGAGNWGALSSVLVDGGDGTGPVTSSPTLKRNPSNGTVNVKVRATADDSSTGKSRITDALYTIDSGLAQPMTVNKTAVVASVDAVIPSTTLDALSEGTHTVAISSMDEAGNWGDPVTIDLVLDKTGPNATDLSVAPNPNNGTMAINASTPAVRVSGLITDPVSAGVNTDIRRAEAFIDATGANNKGIPIGAEDGVWDSTSEVGYTDIPLATIAQLTNGDHTIYVHAQDKARNWGAFSEVTLTIDKAGPVVTNVSVTPNPTAGANSVNLTATATDASGVQAAEWWIAPNPGTGNGTPMSVSGNSLSATIDVSSWTPGNYRIRVRAKDTLGNWGRRSSVVLTVN